MLFKLTFFNRDHPALLALDPPILIQVACLRLTHQVLLHRLPPHSIRYLCGFLTLPPLQVMLAAGALQDVLLLVVPARRTVLVVELGPLGRRVGVPSIG